MGLSARSVTQRDRVGVTHRFTLRLMGSSLDHTCALEVCGL
jgi:hypothetical protein